MPTNLNVTELDFDQIKNNLKNYLKSQSEFNDYDFEGSGLSILLDVLAYNTHYNAMAAHYSLNEAFLDSAQIRGNVVSRAKLLGYTPRSILTPRASVEITVDIAGKPNPPSSLTLKTGTKLSTNISGEEYQFVVLEEQTAIKVGNFYTFNDVPIGEGSWKTIKYRVDNDIENQKFQILDEDVDTSTMEVRVQSNENSSSFVIYTPFETLLNINPSSTIYHLQENASGYYEVFFGDGIIGKKPSNDNIITLNYVYSHAGEANGADSFTMNDNIGGYSEISIKLLSPASGGTIKETLESIRYNAPLSYTTQNRAVTADDYRSIIQAQFTNIDSISAWGGENSDPPDYGKVFVSIKPLVAEVLTDVEKSQITDVILKGKNVVSIVPTIVDPNYTYLKLYVAFKYNPNITDRSSVELSSVVRDSISDYDYNNLNRFDGVFRHSELLKVVDNSDPAILNSTVIPYMYKSISAKAAGGNDFDLTYAAPFYYSPGQSTDNILYSTAFKINGEDCYFADAPIRDMEERKIFIYKEIKGKRIMVLPNVGIMDVERGRLRLHTFRPDADIEIQLGVTPNSLDLAPKRDQLISIDALQVDINPAIDTIAVAGSSGTVDYETTPRFTRNS